MLFSDAEPRWGPWARASEGPSAVLAAPLAPREAARVRAPLTPQPHMREGYVMALRNAVDEYARAILHEGAARPFRDQLLD